MLFWFNELHELSRSMSWRIHIVIDPGAARLSIFCPCSLQLAIRSAHPRRIHPSPSWRAAWRRGLAAVNFRHPPGAIVADTEPLHFANNLDEPQVDEAGAHAPQGALRSSGYEQSVRAKGLRAPSRGWKGF